MFVLNSPLKEVYCTTLLYSPQHSGLPSVYGCAPSTVDPVQASSAPPTSGFLYIPTSDFVSTSPSSVLSLLQVLLLLCIADWMVHSMWRSGKDPDSFSIPYLTALGDLLGTALLALSFHFLWVIGDQDSDVGD